MPGGSYNIDVAHHLTEHRRPAPTVGHEILEIVEALVLAVVAIATAWSGYQAALCGIGHQSEHYGVAARLRVQAEVATITGNLERLFDAATVAEWLKAEAQGPELFELRILPGFRPAFEARKNTDPINNPNAPEPPSR